MMKSGIRIDMRKMQRILAVGSKTHHTIIPKGQTNRFIVTTTSTSYPNSQPQQKLQHHEYSTTTSRLLPKHHYLQQCSQQQQRQQKKLFSNTNIQLNSQRLRYLLHSGCSLFHSTAFIEDEQEPSSNVKQYSTPELTADAARHKAGLNDPDVPPWQNPLHHNNPELQKKFREDFASDEEFEAAVIPAPPLETEDGKVAAPEYLHEIAEEIVHLTMLEMSELINKIADHYGFHEGMLSPDDDELATSGIDDEEGSEGSGGTAEAAVTEKTTFDIRLVEFDAAAKIKVIKEVRSIAGLGLKEAKEIVEGAPKIIMKDIKKEQAEEIKSKLEQVGAKIEIV